MLWISTESSFIILIVNDIRNFFFGLQKPERKIYYVVYYIFVIDVI